MRNTRLIVIGAVAALALALTVALSYAGTNSAKARMAGHQIVAASVQHQGRATGTMGGRSFMRHGNFRGHCRYDCWDNGRHHGRGWTSHHRYFNRNFRGTGYRHHGGCWMGSRGAYRHGGHDRGRCGGWDCC